MAALGNYPNNSFADALSVPVSMLFRYTPVAHWNFNAWGEVVVNQGGSWSGKTIAILQVLMTYAISKPRQRILVVGQDVPNLKAGAILDALNIIYASPLLQAYLPKKYYNHSDRRIDFKNGSFIKFNAFENAQDAKSGKRDYLFVNEANGLPYDVYEMLQLRTEIRTFLDYNPNTEFWVHDRLRGEKNVQFIYSNFSHNPFCPESTVRKLIRYKETDDQLWKIFGLGVTGRIEGLIFPKYNIVPEWPPELRKRGYGLDFGFTNDPAAMVDAGVYNGQLYVDQLIYETNLTNPQLAARMGQVGVSKSRTTWADSAEPKSVKELRDLGWPVQSVQKGPDSIRYSIQLIKEFPMINIIAGSRDLQKEIGAYRWALKKKVDTPLNVPVDHFNHLMDAFRYWGLGNLGRGSGIIAT